MNNFVEKYNDNRKTSGVGGALYFKKPSDSKYAFAFATGTIPSFVGDTNTYDAFVITEQYAGKTEGQQTLEKQDIPVMWHRDMKMRAIELSEMGELDWLVVAPDYSAEQITGTLTYKRGDLGDSTLEGTMSITPSAMTPDKILDCRSMLMPTCKFAKNGVETIVPDSVKLPTGDGTTEINLPLDSGVTVETRVLDGMGNEVADAKLTVSKWAANTAEKLTLTGSNTAEGNTEYYLVEIKISESGKQSWRQTVAVEVPATEAA